MDILKRVINLNAYRILILMLYLMLYFNIF